MTSKYRNQAIITLEQCLAAMRVPNPQDLSLLLIQTFGSFRTVCQSTVPALMEVEGMTEETAYLLSLLPQIAARYVEDLAIQAPRFDEENLIKTLWLEVGHEDSNYFYAVYLNGHQKVTKKIRLFRGTLDHIFVYPRTIAKQALAYKARTVITARFFPLDFEYNDALTGLNEIAAAMDLLLVNYKAHLLISPSRTATARRGPGNHWKIFRHDFSTKRTVREFGST